VYTVRCSPMQHDENMIRLFPFVDFSLLSQSKLRLLEEDNSTLETLEIHGNHAVLIEGW